MKSTNELSRPKFEEGPCWEIPAATNFADFLAAVELLGLRDSILYIEAGAPAPSKMHVWLRAHRIEDSAKISGGTVLPSPVIYRIPATSSALRGMASLAGDFMTPTGSLHIHIYHNADILLQWYDAFLDPIFLSLKVSEDSVRRFAKKLNRPYKLRDG